MTRGSVYGIRDRAGKAGRRAEREGEVGTVPGK